MFDCGVGDQSVVTTDLGHPLTLAYTIYGPLYNGGTSVLINGQLLSDDPGI